MLNPLLRLHDFLYEHFRFVFGVVALRDDAVVLSVVYAFDTSADELSFLVGEGSLLSLVLLYFLLEDFGDGLIS